MGECDKLSDEELMYWLQDVGNISVSSDVLRSPMAMFVQNVFTSLMGDMQLSLEGLKMPSWNAAQVLQWPELYDNTLPLILYYSYARQIADVAGLGDLAVTDLTEPKPKRTKKILCYLISLWKHVLTKYEKYNEVKGCMQARNDEKQALQKRWLECEEQYKQMGDVEPADHEEAVQLKSSLEKQMMEIKKRKEEITKEYQNVKIEIADRQNKMSDLDVNMITQKERLEELKSAILKSPNRLASEVDGLKDKVDEENSNVMDIMRQLKEKKQEVQVLESKLEGFRNAVSELTEMLVTAEALRAEAASVSELQDVLKLKSEEVRRDQVLADSTTNKISSLVQRIAQLQLQIKSKIDGLQKLRLMHEGSIGKELKALKCKEELARLLQAENESLSNDLAAQQHAVNSVGSSAVSSISEMLKMFDSFVECNEQDIDGAMKLLKKFLSDSEK